MKDTVPDYPPVKGWGIFFAPAKTPAALVDKLNAAIRHALTVPAVANVVQKSGYVPDDRSSAQVAEFFRAAASCSWSLATVASSAASRRA